MSSYPYPQDRNRDRQDKGDQPYQDAKEAMTETDARLQVDAEAWGERRRDEADGEEDFETEMARRLKEIGDDRGSQDR